MIVVPKTNIDLRSACGPVWFASTSFAESKTWGLFYSSSSWISSTGEKEVEMPGIFLFLISLYLLTACIHGTCVDILSGCKKACSTNGDCDVSTGYYCQKQLCQGLNFFFFKATLCVLPLTWILSLLYKFYNWLVYFPIST